MKNKIAAVILAAGKGTRMNEGMSSDKPKVMYEILGKPMIDYSVKNIKDSGIKDVVLVVGYKKEQIMDYFGAKVEYAVQEEQLGTGHAAMMAESNLKGKGDAVLVCYGDMPLYKSETIKKLIDRYDTEKPTIAMLTVIFDDPVRWAFGRIVRDEQGEIIAIREQKDCAEDELNIKECNPGFYIFDADWLWDNFKKLKSDNAQKEYYLTDMIGIAKLQGKKIISTQVSEETEVLGINTPDQLNEVEEILIKDRSVCG